MDRLLKLIMWPVTIWLGLLWWSTTEATGYDNPVIVTLFVLAVCVLVGAIHWKDKFYDDD